MIESENFRIEGGELFYLSGPLKSVKWGDVSERRSTVGGMSHSFMPMPFDIEDQTNSCGIMSAEVCDEISGLLKRLDKGDNMNPEFEKELTTLINRHSVENKSNTPDFLLAKYLIGCLGLYASATNAREDWYGRTKKPLKVSEKRPVDDTTGL